MGAVYEMMAEQSLKNPFVAKKLRPQSEWIIEEIRDFRSRLACCGDAATGYISSLYKGHRTTAYLAIGETFTVEKIGRAHV